MAGIGFELKRQTHSESLFSHFGTITVAGLIACGPWVFSIVTLFIIAGIRFNTGMAAPSIPAFLVTVTYLIAHSLIISGGFQLLLTRQTADLIFLNQANQVFSALLAILTTMLAITLPIAVILGWQLASVSPAYGLYSSISLLSLCTIWVCILFLSSIRSYKQVIGTLFAGYGLTLLLVLIGQTAHSQDLLFAFMSGQLLSAILLLALIWRHYPGPINLNYALLKPTPLTIKLFLCGLLYNLAIWIDKILFWFSPTLSEPIVGWFRASTIYDLPIFMANLVIIPGLAVFLLVTETDFAQRCLLYFERLNKNASLTELKSLKREMLESYREGLILLCKVQVIASLFMMLISESVFSLFGIEPIYQQIFCVDLIGMSFLMIVMSQLNTLYYLDHLRTALNLTLTFLISNGALTFVSIKLGIQFYGYGFTAATILTSIVGLHFLNLSFSQLEMRSFQRNS
jgi:uncharacterized membrane protein